MLWRQQLGQPCCQYGPAPPSNQQVAVRVPRQQQEAAGRPAADPRNPSHHWASGARSGRPWSPWVRTMLMSLW